MGHLIKERPEYILDAATKKNRTRKKINTIKPALGVAKSNTFGKTTLFPEKLAKLNALLDKAILLPD